jgi:hypothetical protein
MNAAPFLVLVAGRGFIFLPFYVCICNQQSRVSDLPSVCCTLLVQQHPDQQRQRVLSEQLVGVGITGQPQGPSHEVIVARSWVRPGTASAAGAARQSSDRAADRPLPWHGGRTEDLPFQRRKQ